MQAVQLASSRCVTAGGEPKQLHAASILKAVPGGGGAASPLGESFAPAARKRSIRIRFQRCTTNLYYQQRRQTLVWTMMRPLALPLLLLALAASCRASGRSVVDGIAAGQPASPAAAASAPCTDCPLCPLHTRLLALAQLLLPRLPPTPGEAPAPTTCPSAKCWSW